jgi:methylmalonyl-CoA/ethylmalonyl-CoA epimerase
MKQNPLFTRVAQVGLVVRDAEATAKRCWDDFGLGPWTFYTFDPSRVDEMTVRGERIDHAMRIANAVIGQIDWEIIEPLDEKSIYAEHLRERGEGLHHILFDVSDYDDARSRLSATGASEIGSGRWYGHPYSYFDTHESLACLTEIWRPPPEGTPLPPPDATYP